MPKPRRKEQRMPLKINSLRAAFESGLRQKCFRQCLELFKPWRYRYTGSSSISNLHHIFNRIVVSSDWLFVLYVHTRVCLCEHNLFFSSFELFLVGLLGVDIFVARCVLPAVSLSGKITAFFGTWWIRPVSKRKKEQWVFSFFLLRASHWKSNWFHSQTQSCG